MCGSRGCVCVLSAHDSTCVATRKSHSNFQTMVVPNVRTFWTFPFTLCERPTCPFMQSYFGNYAAIKWITLAFSVRIRCWWQNKTALSQINNDQKKKTNRFSLTLAPLSTLSRSILFHILLFARNWSLSKIAKMNAKIRMQYSKWKWTMNERIGANTREKRKCKHAKKLECIQFSSHKQTRKLQANSIIAPSMSDCAGK